MVGKVKAAGERGVPFTAQAEPCGGLEPSSPTAVFLDCAYGQETNATPASGSPAIRVVSLYETRSDHSFDNHPTGQASVQVNDPGPTLLWLEVYEPTNFSVQAGGGASLVDVIAEGYYTPGLVLPLGVPGEIHSYYLDNQVNDCPDWSGNPGDCINDVEPQRVLEHTGLCVASIDACYRATQIVLP